MADRRRNRELRHLHPWHGIGPCCFSGLIVIVGLVAFCTFVAALLQRTGG